MTLFKINGQTCVQSECLSSPHFTCPSSPHSICPPCPGLTCVQSECLSSPHPTSPQPSLYPPPTLSALPALTLPDLPAHPHSTRPPPCPHSTRPPSPGLTCEQSVCLSCPHSSCPPSPLFCWGLGDRNGHQRFWNWFSRHLTNH